jgi:hypothetical protein
MKRIFIFCIGILFYGLLFSQQNMTMYFMSVPQANITNPAIYSHCKLTFSGILIPLSGQLIPPIYLNYNNNGFAYKDFIHHGTGIRSDSLVIDFPNLIDKMKKVNYINLETHIPWINISYIWQNWYFSFGINEKIYASISIPRDLIVLAWEGNGKSLLGQKAFLSFLGANVNWHREYSLGAATNINNKLTVGGRAKLLFGKANLWFKNNKLTWHTNEENFAYTINADFDIRESQPIYDIIKLAYDYDNDSLIFEDTTLIDNPTFNDIKQKIIFNSKNKGIALDLGTKYIFNDKITLYASLLDLGFIRYKQNAESITAKGEFYFDGWNIQPYLEGKDSIVEENNKAFTDSVIKLFDPKHYNKAYNYWLTSKLYLGATYKLTDKYNIGLLIRNDYFLKRFHSAVSLSFNAKFTKWFSSNLSYTIQNNSFKNLGLGFALKFGFYQWYMVSDNIFGFIYPQSTRTINLRMGLNMIFGCNKKEVKTLLNTNFIQ